MELAHAGDDGLAGLFIGIGSERGILFSQLRQRDAHLFLAGLGLRLDGDTDNRLGELHALQDDRMLFVAQRIARGGVLQAHGSRDIAGVADIDILTVVGVHLQDAAHALAVVLHGVVDRAAGVRRYRSKRGRSKAYRRTGRSRS